MSRRRTTDELGASAVEYGLIAVAVAGLIVVIVFAFGGLVNDTYKSSCDEIRAKASPSSSC